MSTDAAIGLSRLQPLPADPLLGLMVDYRADARSDKMDLGVGVYRDETGVTPLMDAVGRAEARLAAEGRSKVYEGPRGNLAFCSHIEELALGGGRDALGDRLTSFATPGGCGALFVAMGLVARASPAARVWMSAPSWPNHPKVASAVGLTSVDYRYYNPGAGRSMAAAMLEDLEAAAPGDAVLIQGPCHNPTGADLPLPAWDSLAALCAERRLMPVIDLAYHGLGEGLEDDAAGVRAFIAASPQALLCYSCSKNFGLYRERAGALMMVGETPAAIAAATTHAADLARTSYSMPPAHGPALVATILGDDDLAQSWRDELASMRARIEDLRTGLVAALSSALDADRFAAVGEQKGMFSMLPLPDGGPARLRSDYGIYLPDSARINVAGLRQDQIAPFARAVANVCVGSPAEHAP